MKRSIIWMLALAVVVTAGIAVTFSPEPTKMERFAQKGDAPKP
jgi:hypothetical protein